MFEERRHGALAMIRPRRDLIDKRPRSPPGWSQASPTPETPRPPARQTRLRIAAASCIRQFESDMLETYPPFEMCPRDRIKPSNGSVGQILLFSGT